MLLFQNSTKPVPLRFHWAPAEDFGGVEALIGLCRRAEAAGVESVELNAPELVLAAASKTEALAFRVTHDVAAAIPPDALGARRLIVRIKIDHIKDADLAQAGRDLERLRKRFEGSAIHVEAIHVEAIHVEAIHVEAIHVEAIHVEAIHVEGDTAEAAWLAIQHADCLFRCAGPPGQAYADALPVLHMGKAVGLIAPVIARRGRDEAIEAAAGLAGARGVLAGSFEEVAAALLAYWRTGIAHFLGRERQGCDDLTAFATGVMPLVRELERGRAAVASHSSANAGIESNAWIE
jgi:hypothetical protein